MNESPPFFLASTRAVATCTCERSRVFCRESGLLSRLVPRPCVVLGMGKGIPEPVGRDVHHLGWWFAIRATGSQLGFLKEVLGVIYTRSTPEKDWSNGSFGREEDNRPAPPAARHRNGSGRADPCTIWSQMAPSGVITISPLSNPGWIKIIRGIVGPLLLPFPLRWVKTGAS